MQYNNPVAFGILPKLYVTQNVIYKMIYRKKTSTLLSPMKTISIVQNMP